MQYIIQIQETLYERHSFYYMYIHLYFIFKLLIVVAVHTRRASVGNSLPKDKVSIPLKTNSIIVTEEPTTKGEINTIYIVLAGVGILIGLFLFVLVIQIYTCKRSKSTKTNKVLKRNNGDDAGTSDASADNVNNVNNQNVTTSREHPRMRSKTKKLQPAESFYHDVEDSSELKYSPVIPNASQEYEVRCHLQMPDLSYSPLSIKDSVLVQQMQEKQVGSICGRFDGMKSDMYLHPITVRKEADGIAV